MPSTAAIPAATVRDRRLPSQPGRTQDERQLDVAGGVGFPRAL